jgi:PAS domain S-box-containing protein
MKNQNQYYETVIKNSPAAIVIIDTNTIIKEWNPAAENLFGYSRDEVIGKDLDRLITNTEIISEAVESTKKTHKGEEYRATTRRVRKDGSLVDVEVLAVPIYADNSEITDFMAIYHDITELQLARQEALAASQAKSDFLANMSHEIRTPMNGVIGMTSLLMDTPLNSEQREYVETIRKSGEALLSIINDILDFSKIEAGKLELETQDFDLRECIESAVDLVAFQASTKNLELLYNLEEDLPIRVVGDVTRLHQIITNLLSNAVKFTEKGEVELSVEKGETREEGITIRFTVRDTGIGIPADQIDRLFRSFSQVDASTTRRFGGTGLGLSISRRLTELMGGRIEIQSMGEVGKGSTFIVSLPFGMSDGNSRPSHTRPRLCLRGKTVLIVDDNPTNRLILTRMTTSWGMEPVECASGKQALDKINEGLEFDAALLDVQMPEMDGITLEEELRKTASGLIPTIILSSIGSRIDLPSRPGIAFLHKPIKPSNLYDTLCAVMAVQPDAAGGEDSEKEDFDYQMAVRHPLHILLAEDHPVNQKVVRLMLERLGYRTDIVGNGLEVIEAFHRQDYDVVLMDIQMPEMNGVQAAQTLRETLPPEKQPRIVALTANALGGERDRYIAAGMDDYLSKPFNVLQIREILEKCMPLNIATEAAPANSTAGKKKPGDSESKKMDGEKVIDVELLREYFPYQGEDLKIVVDLAREFIDDTGERMRSLQAYLNKGDLASFSSTSHAIKGASLSFGAISFSSLCREMELIGKTGSMQGAQEILTKADDEFEKVGVELLRILEEMMS